MPFNRTCPTCNSPFTAKWSGRQFCSQLCGNRNRPKRQSDLNRLLSKREIISTCWMFTGSRLPHGYGQLRVDGQAKPAHVLAWLWMRGPIPTGLYVCHNCPGGDNPACFNPEHLWLGTQAENLNDMVLKDRSSGVLTVALAREIRARYAAGGISQRALAAHYGVTQGAINSVLLRKTWKHVA